MLTTAQILDPVMASLTDTSAVMRNKCLIWLNQSMQNIVLMRPWSFMDGTKDITAVLGIFAWPTDYGQMISISYDQTCLYPSDLMSDKDFSEEAYNISDRWKNEATGFSVWPTGQTTVSLHYSKQLSDYADGATTLFPVEMLNVLVRATLARAYEYDMDERSTGSMVIYQQALKEAKKWDNAQKPLPRRNKHNMLWSNT